MFSGVDAVPSRWRFATPKRREKSVTRKEGWDGTKAAAGTRTFKKAASVVTTVKKADGSLE
jgi:hypothetical protein